MKIRRSYQGDDTLQTEVQAAGGDWRPGARPGGLVLPFQPVSVRDFSLSEQHNIDAAVGYARRFMPGAARLAGAVQAVTRRSLPALRPNRLWYAQSIYYLNNPMTFVPSGTDVKFPSYTRALDYELQLAFVVGEPLHDAAPEEAERAITAFTVMCDFSARDVQIPEMKSGMGPQKAKHFLSSMATVAVSADEVLPRWRELTGTVTVNGEVVARPHTAGSRFGLGDMLAHASASEQLIRGRCSASARCPPAAAWRSAAGSGTATLLSSTSPASAASPTRSSDHRARADVRAGMISRTGGACCALDVTAGCRELSLPGNRGFLA
jgi:hypothetical protein